MLKNKIKIIDCTLRDGGYYNNWLFDTETVNQYLYDCHNSKIDIIELGFRFLSKDNNFGPYAYSTDNFLSKLNKGISNISGNLILPLLCSGMPNLFITSGSLKLH